VDSSQTLVQEHRPRNGAAPETAAAERPSESLTIVRAGPAVESPPRVPEAPAAHASEGVLLHGRYRLIERLGAGGFGVVWRAHDELLHREVALKRIPLPPDLPAVMPDEDEPRAGERASREALATARLAHPAIVALHEAHADDDAFYLVSELIEGDTLAQLIAQDALSDEQLLEIGVTLANALAHAHARGVIHRDVKPQNVLVPHAPGSREAPAKLTDFGGASLAGEQALTRTGETLGTLAYMAPEQSEGLQIDESADVYSLALVIYEGLTGCNPVRGPTPAATVRRIGRPLPALAARRPDLPRALTDAIDTALAVSPAQRGTLHELRSALEQALTEGPTRRRGLLPRRAERRHDDAPASSVRRSRGLPLPRAVWAGCVLAVAAWQVAIARPGVALLLLAATVPLLLLGPRPGLGWLIAALAPALGLIGLAGAYPAVAGQAPRWSRRAAYGALGYWWLALAEPLLSSSGNGSSRLWLGPPAAPPPRAVWEGSLDGAAVHVIAPTLTVGLVCGAALWAAAAAVLPLVVRGSSAIRDTIAALAWSTALLAATPYFDAGLSAGGVLPQPRGAVLGALVGAAIAIAGRALRGPVCARHP
jgi:hypothetical protein